MKFKVESFTQGKPNGSNEDFFDYNGNTFVLVDGMLDKNKRTYNGKTGAEFVSRLVTKDALKSTKNGSELIEELNNSISKIYEEYNMEELIHKDPKMRLSCSLIVARIVQNKLKITYLGDCGFRINGNEVYQEVKEVDTINSNKRSDYIKKTGDIQAAREHIIQDIIKQYDYQNKKDEKLGFGVLDGTKTPNKFIKTFEYDLGQIKTLELFTDGYFRVADEVSIKSWEESYELVEKEDPDKYLEYKSTKSKDDRTIAIIRFN